MYLLFFQINILDKPIRSKEKLTVSCMPDLTICSKGNENKSIDCEKLEPKRKT